MSTKERAQTNALGEYLCEWDDLTYDQVLLLLRAENYHDRIDVWEGVERESGEHIAGLIENHYNNLMAFVEEIK
jgi:hypothetical protein